MIAIAYFFFHFPSRSFHSPPAGTVPRLPNLLQPLELSNYTDTIDTTRQSETVNIFNALILDFSILSPITCPLYCSLLYHLALTAVINNDNIPHELDNRVL